MRRYRGKGGVGGGGLHSTFILLLGISEKAKSTLLQQENRVKGEKRVEEL